MDTFGKRISPQVIQEIRFSACRGRKLQLSCPRPADNRCGNPNSCLVASFGCSQTRLSFRSRCLPPRDRVTNHLSPPLRVRRLLARRWLFWLRHSCLAAVFATLVLLAFQVVFFWHSRSSGTAASLSKEQPTFLVTESSIPQRASSVGPPQLPALTAIFAGRQ